MATAHPTCAVAETYHYPRPGLSLFELAASSGRGLHSAVQALCDEPARSCAATQRARESAVAYEYPPALVGPMQNRGHDRQLERCMHRGNSPPGLVGSRGPPPSHYYGDPHEQRYHLGGAGFVGRVEARNEDYVPGAVPGPHYMPHDGGRSDRRAPSSSPHSSEARLSPCAGTQAAGLMGAVLAGRSNEAPHMDREPPMQAGKRPHEDAKLTSHGDAAAGGVDGLTSIAANGLMSMRHTGSSATLLSAGSSPCSGGGAGGPPCGAIPLEERVGSERSDEDSSEEAGSRGRKRRKHGERRAREAREAERDDSDRDDDRKRRWMTKEQAKACQDKFDDWGGSLRGKQEEVLAFSKSIGLTALQVEKRFAYIRKHYDRVSKKLTITDDLARDDGPFAKCPVAVQSLLVQRLQELARHEMDCRRIVGLLVRLAKGCRLGSEQVVVRPSRHHMSCLAEGLQRASVVPRLHRSCLPLELRPADGGASLEEVDVVWAACRSGEGDRLMEGGRPAVAVFHIDGGDPLTPGALQKAADCCLQYGTGVFNYIVVPSGRANHMAHRRHGPWVHALMNAVPGLAATRVIHEDSLDSLLAGQQGSNPQQGTDALELLDSVSEQL